MKKIEIDDSLYEYIASQTKVIGESSSDILRRLLGLSQESNPVGQGQSDLFTLQAEKIELKETKPLSVKSRTILKKIKASEKDRLDRKNSADFVVAHLNKILKSDEFINEKKNVKKFLMILSGLYFTAKNRFTEAVLQTKGAERLYFSRNKEEILKTGNGVRVRKIPGTPFWVNSNNNSERKGRILVKILTQMELPKDIIDQVRKEFY